jgi:hypothetical protein
LPPIATQTLPALHDVPQQGRPVEPHAVQATPWHGTPLLLPDPLLLADVPPPLLEELLEAIPPPLELPTPIPICVPLLAEDVAAPSSSGFATSLAASVPASLDSVLTARPPHADQAKVEQIAMPGTPSHDRLARTRISRQPYIERTS